MLSISRFGIIIHFFTHASLDGPPQAHTFSFPKDMDKSQTLLKEHKKRCYKERKDDGSR
jgi:hypothetical protein